jgi:hypothetical protein
MKRIRILLILNEGMAKEACAGRAAVNVLDRGDTYLMAAWLMPEGIFNSDAPFE